MHVTLFTAQVSTAQSATHCAVVRGVSTQITVSLFLFVVHSSSSLSSPSLSGVYSLPESLSVSLP
ncbi:hypothetical protein OAM67_01810 [bacterium]|nr:hypothetical protein [bacterium]